MYTLKQVVLIISKHVERKHQNMSYQDAQWKYDHS